MPQQHPFHRSRSRTWRRASALAVWVTMASASSLLAQNAPAARARATLTLASTPWPPLTDAAGRTRLALDLVEEALKRIGVTATTTIIPEGSLTPALLKRQFAGSAALWRDAERERTLLFSEPYLENRLMLVGRAGSDVSATSVAALAGKRLALVQGYAYGDSVTDSPTVTIVPARTIEESVEQVLSGAADYALIEELVIEQLVENYPKEVGTRLALGIIPLLKRTLHLALRRDIPDAQSIISRFNAALPTMIADRSYHRLLHIQWLETDIDGDGSTEFVPSENSVSASAPRRAYQLFTPTATGNSSAPPESKHFYIGGTMYEDWAQVPNAMKVKAEGAPAPFSAGGSIFTIRW
jgi:polar amino acid transport system substrate-binding protein